MVSWNVGRLAAGLQQTEIKILMLSMYDDGQFVARALKAEIDGYLLKHAMDDELFRAIKTVLAGATFILPSPNGSKHAHTN